MQTKSPGGQPLVPGGHLLICVWADGRPPSSSSCENVFSMLKEVCLCFCPLFQFLSLSHCLSFCLCLWSFSRYPTWKHQTIFGVHLKYMFINSLRFHTCIQYILIIFTPRSYQQFLPSALPAPTPTQLYPVFSPPNSPSPWVRSHSLECSWFIRGHTLRKTD